MTASLATPAPMTMATYYRERREMKRNPEMLMTDHQGRTVLTVDAAWILTQLDEQANDEIRAAKRQAEEDGEPWWPDVKPISGMRSYR